MKYERLSRLVKTEMGGSLVELTVEQGADTPIWLALLPEDGPTGDFDPDYRVRPEPLKTVADLWKLLKSAEG